jgi:hypothetical protein
LYLRASIERPGTVTDVDVDDDADVAIDGDVDVADDADVAADVTASARLLLLG